jgi:hypothetical protein
MSDDETTCATCGHALDEHLDDGGECDVEGCDCVLFEVSEEAFLA